MQKTSINLDKRGIRFYLISPKTHILWTLISSAFSLGEFFVSPGVIKHILRKILFLLSYSFIHKRNFKKSATCTYLLKHFNVC